MRFRSLAVSSVQINEPLLARMYRMDDPTRIRYKNDGAADRIIHRFEFTFRKFGK